jgi:lipopolysaccharide transport system permease protein
MQDNPETALVIRAGGSGQSFWKELWQNRQVLYILIWRDLKVRYKQTLIGVAWAIVRPLVTTIIFTYLFHSLAGLKVEDKVPYALLVLTGTLAWQFFSSAFQDAASSLLNNATLISKVYFPRMVVPASTLGVALVDFLITFVMVSVYLLYCGLMPGPEILLLPVFIALAMVSSFGLGLLFAAWTVRYRDLRFVIPFVVQFGLFLSPVGFSSDQYKGNWASLFYLNPMTGIIDGFRWSLLGMPVEFSRVLISVVSSIVIFYLGVYVFRKQEAGFVDQL